MTKNEIVDSIATKATLTKKDSKVALDGILEVITETLAKGDNVQFVGFGTFEVVTRAARTARVPGTGAEVKVPAKKAAKFKVGKALKNSVKN